jgi:hypothetical protein
MEAYRAQLVGLHHEHPDELLHGDHVVVPQLPVERAFLPDLLEPPDVVAEDGRVVLAVELAAVVPDDEGLGHGLLDPGAVVAAGHDADADAELAAADPGRVVRELEVAHRGAALPHGEADIAGEQRALALALLHDPLLELLGGPVLAAVGREVTEERDQLDAQRLRERGRGAGVRVHEDDLQRGAAGVLNLAAREDRELRRGPERQLPRRALGGRRRRRPLDVARALHQPRLDLLLHLNVHEKQSNQNKNGRLIEEMANGESSCCLTTRRKRGSRNLNRFVMCLCIMASRITLEFNGDSVSQALGTNGQLAISRTEEQRQLARVRGEGRQAAHPLVVGLVAVVLVPVVEPLRCHCCYAPRDRCSPLRALEGPEAISSRGKTRCSD